MNSRLLAGVLRSALPLVILLAGIALVLRVFAGIDDLGSLPEMRRAWLIIPAAACLIATTAAYVLLWRMVISSVDAARPPLPDAVATFVCSWLGRHVPTSAPYVAGKIVLGQRLGYGRAAVAASLVYENALVVAVAGAAGAVVLAALLPWPVSGVLIVVAAASCAAVGLIASPVVPRLARAGARRVPRLAPLADVCLAPAAVARASCVALSSTASNGATFVLLLAVFQDLTLRDAAVAWAAFNLAGAAGIAAVPVPSGIGVREAVLVALMHGVAPLEVTLAAAMLARLITLPLDLGAGMSGAAWLAYRARRRDRDAVLSAREPARAA